MIEDDDDDDFAALAKARCADPTRIAYSTVDTDRPKTFAYVAVVKGSKLALCHVFSCKSAKQVYNTLLSSLLLSLPLLLRM